MSRKKDNKPSHLMGLIIIALAVAAAAGGGKAALSKGGHALTEQIHQVYVSGSVGQYQAYAQKVFGNDAVQQRCLVLLWNQESGWNPGAVESSWISGPPTYAYGIPQINPNTWGHPVSQSDWKGQIRWGRDYIRRDYGTPCGAWSHEQRYNWY